MEEYTGVNEVEVAEQPQNEEVTEQVQPQAETEEIATPQSKPVQDAETNAQFARVRREAEQRAKDQLIAEMYGDQGIRTYAEYQQALQRQKMAQEAEQKGIDPEFYNQFKTLEQKLNSYEQEKTLLQQDQQLANDPKYGEIYKQWKGEVVELAQKYNVDYDTAFTFLTREKLPDLINNAKTKAEQSAIQKIAANGSASPGSLETGTGETEFISADAFEKNKHDQRWVIKNLSKITKSRPKW
jgi:hypothetical protein